MGERPVPAREVLDAAALLGFADRACRALSEARDEIDRLNVFPVPDGDTGSNLLATMRAARQAAQDAGGGAAADDPSLPVSAVATALARGALSGARGNAGTLLSQVLLGWAGAVEGRATATADDVCTGLRAAATAVREALGDPVEGTLLTVARAAADAAAEAVEAAGDPAAAGSGTALADVLAAACAGATEALAQTPHQLAVLAREGVVDAGGRGLVVVLRALEAEVLGAPEQPEEVQAPPEPAEVAAASADGPRQRPGGPAYEVMYLLDATRPAVARLRAALRPLGDSLVVTGSAADDQVGLWHVHVHVDDVGAAVEAGVEAGRPHRIRVTRLEDVRGEQHGSAAVTRTSPDAPGTGAAVPPSSREGRAVVAVVPPGLVPLVEEAGAAPVVAGPPAPTADDLVRAVGDAVAECVLLPGGAVPDQACQEAASRLRAAGVAVEVVSTGSVLSSLAALAVAHPAASLEEDAAGMRQAAGAVRSGALVDAGDPAAVRGLLQDLAADGCELVTVVTGPAAGPEVVAHLQAHLAEHHPSAELVVYEGGQPDAAVLLGVE